MRRLRWIAAAALVLAVAEFLVLFGVVKLIGIPGALLTLVGLSLIGGALLRSEGVRAWRRMRAARGRGPVGDEVLDGVAGLLAALLLLLPGYLTALTGLLMLLPPVRRVVRTWLRGATERRVPSQVAGDLFGPRQVRVRKTAPAAESDEVIEGEIVD